ncbi:MAG: MMPL family transporter [Pseudomonadota bacterium]
MNRENDYLQKAGKSFGRLAVWIYDHRWIVLVICILFLGAGLYFASKAVTDSSLESSFSRDDPTYKYYLDYQKDFGSDEVAYILYKAPGKKYGPFDLEVMRKIASLTEALENEVPFVREVTSLANVEFIEAEGDFIEIHELLLDFPKTQEQLLHTRELVMKKPIYIGGLINSAGDHAAIILEMTRASNQPLEEIRFDPKGGDGIDNLYPQVSNLKIREILSRPEYKDIVFYPSGDVPINSVYYEVLSNETSMLTLITFLVVGIMGMICFRMRFLGVAGPLTVVLLSLVLTVGFMGLVGYTIGLLFMMIPTLLTAIGVAQSVHLLSEFQIYLSKGLDRREALRQASELVGMPCFLAALTTAAGFFAMVISQLKMMSDFAVFGSVGVLFAFILSFTLLICLLSFSRKNKSYQIKAIKTEKRFLSRILDWVTAYNLKNQRIILIISVIILIFSFIGISKLKVAYNFIEEFKENTEVRQTLTYADKVMGGFLNIVYIFDTKKPDGIKDSDVLKRLEELQMFAEKNPLVQKTYSIVDILKDINQSFHGGDPAYYKLPESRELTAQYLLMYEMSGGKELEDYVTSDYSKTVLELRAGLSDSIVLKKLLDDLQVYMDENPITEADVKLTGIGLLWVKIADYIGSSQIYGYILAFCMIACMLCILFRSIKVGMLCMIPNLTPVILILGFMGWKGMHLDYFRLLLATIAIGIAVDDTVHLTTRIRREFLLSGDYRQALKNSLHSVGQAMIITSVVLVSAFLVFLYSSMAVLASFGVLLAITISAALVADLFLMPALILAFKPFGKEFKVEVVKSSYDR